MIEKRYLLVIFLISFLFVAAVIYLKGMVDDADVDMLPDYDSGWLDITTQVGHYFNITHNLNCSDVVVDVRGKVTVDGEEQQCDLGTGDMLGWNKTYGGPGDDRGYSLVETGDGGYAIAGMVGYDCGPPDCDFDFWLIKADVDGNALWNRTYGRRTLDRAYSVLQTSDGGYAMIGRSHHWGSTPSEEADIWLVKVDSSGDAQWNKTYGGVNWDLAWSFVQTSDGGYAIAAFTDSFGAGDRDFWLIKTDATGGVEWNRTYGDTGRDEAMSIVQTSDGGYAMAGSTDSYGAGSSDFWLVRTDSSGELLWNRTYGEKGYDSARFMVQTDDEGFAIVGYTASYGVGWDFWLVKTDALGSALWNKTYDGGDIPRAYSLIQTNDGGYAIAGDDFMLIKTDMEGNMDWNRTYGGVGSGHGMCLIETSDGRYVMAGAFQPIDADWNDLLLVKTSAESGLTWTGSTADTITFYRGLADSNWNYVRVLVWKNSENP